MISTVLVQCGHSKIIRLLIMQKITVFPQTPLKGRTVMAITPLEWPQVPPFTIKLHCSVTVCDVFDPNIYVNLYMDMADNDILSLMCSTTARTSIRVYCFIFYSLFCYDHRLKRAYYCKIMHWIDFNQLYTSCNNRLTSHYIIFC